MSHRAVSRFIKARFELCGSIEMMDFQREEFERTVPAAQHEFGHYLVARTLGFVTGDVALASVTAMAGPGGQVDSNLLVSITDIKSMIGYCERRVQVLMAGVLSEAIEAGLVDHEKAILFAETSGANDYAKWRELINILRNGSHPETTDPSAANAELQAISDRLWNAAATLLVSRWTLINELSQELARRRVFNPGPAVFSAAELGSHPLLKESFG